MDVRINFSRGQHRHFCLSFSGFNANGRSQNALKVPSPNFQGEQMPVLPTCGRPWEHHEPIASRSINNQLDI